MPSVNLAPGTQHVIAARKRRRRLFAIAFLLMAVVGAAWGMLFAYHLQLKQQAEDVQSQLSAVQSELARLNDDADRVELFERQLDALSGLLDRHLEWEPVLQGIERLMPQVATLSSFEANADTGTIFLSGRTADIDQLSQTIASLNAETSPFSLGKLSGVNRVETPQGEGEPPIIDYVFELELTFDRELINP